MRNRTAELFKRAVKRDVCRLSDGEALRVIRRELHLKAHNSTVFNACNLLPDVDLIADLNVDFNHRAPNRRSYGKLALRAKHTVIVILRLSETVFSRGYAGFAGGRAKLIKQPVLFNLVTLGEGVLNNSAGNERCYGIGVCRLQRSRARQLAFDVSLCNGGRYIHRTHPSRGV